jgi:hypothetical protein
VVESGGLENRCTGNPGTVGSNPTPSAVSTQSANVGRVGLMARLLRIALQVVLFFLLLSLAVAIGSGDTGAVEKVALSAAAGVLVWLASRVRRIGAPIHQA